MHHFRAVLKWFVKAIQKDFQKTFKKDFLSRTQLLNEVRTTSIMVNGQLITERNGVRNKVLQLSESIKGTGKSASFLKLSIKNENRT